MNESKEYQERVKHRETMRKMKAFDGMSDEEAEEIMDSIEQLCAILFEVHNDNERKKAEQKID